MADRLHDFARAVASRQSEVDVVDDSVMHAIALDLGMTEDDIVQARAEGQARKERARTLRQRSLIDDAITELEQASAWNPLDVEVLTMLADCLVRRARKTHNVDDMERARSLCLQALKVAPGNAEAPALLQVIQMNPVGESHQIPLGVIGGILAFVAIVAAIVAFVFS